jgi:surface antigen
VRNLTVVGKFLTLTALLGSLVACGHLPQQSDSINRSAAVVSPSGVGSVMFAFNVLKWQSHTLNNEQKRKQNSAVHAALESEYGTVYNWYEHDAKGSVKAVHGYPINSGYCRVIYSMIEVKGKARHFEETACQSSGTQNEWRWVGK